VAGIGWQSIHAVTSLANSDPQFELVDRIVLRT